MTRFASSCSSSRIQLSFVITVVLLAVQLHANEDALTNGTKGLKSNCTKCFAPYLIEDAQMEPDNIVANSGRSVRMRCNFAARPKHKVQWFKDKKLFKGRQNGELWTMDNLELYLENLTPKDSGQYMCKATNKAGQANHTYSLSVEHTLAHPPVIDTRLLKPRDDISIGENVTLECRFESTNAAIFNWQRSVDPLAEESDASQWRIVQNDTSVADGVDPHYYRIPNFSAADEGKYRCWTWNFYGEMDYVVELSLAKIPDPASVTAVILPRSLTVDIALAAAAVIALAVIVFTYLKMRKYKKHQITVVHAEQSFIIRRVVLEHDNGGKCLSPRVKIETETVNLNQLGAAEKKRALNEYQLPLDKDWEVARDKLVIGEKLGEGAFGVVFKATARGLHNKEDTATTEVAVKMLKDAHTDSDLRDLVSEMEVMKKVGRHTNIISLLGCVTQDGPPYVIVEFAANGNLKDWLKKHNPRNYGMSSGAAAAAADADGGRLQKRPGYVSVQKLVDYAVQIAKGMKFLSSMKCIHRDLAARNVLVTDDETMKIADFGLARDLVNIGCYYKSNNEHRLPVRWMAPETIFNAKYTCQSDVWSFGVVLWELFTFGMDPFDGSDPIAILRCGGRMTQPELCPSEVYNLMRAAWAQEPVDRPTFEQLCDSLDEMRSRYSNSEYLDLSLFAPKPEDMSYTYESFGHNELSDRIRVYENQARYTNHAIISQQTTKLNPSYFNNVRLIHASCPVPPPEIV